MTKKKSRLLPANIQKSASVRVLENIHQWTRLCK